MFEKEKLDDILGKLVGSHVSINYRSSAAGEEDTIAGVLESVTKDVIKVKDKVFESTVWINRHGAVLTSVRLLRKKKGLKLP